MFEYGLEVIVARVVVGKLVNTVCMNSILRKGTQEVSVEFVGGADPKLERASASVNP